MAKGHLLTQKISWHHSQSGSCWSQRARLSLSAPTPLPLASLLLRDDAGATSYPLGTRGTDLKRLNPTTWHSCLCQEAQELILVWVCTDLSTAHTWRVRNLSSVCYLAAWSSATRCDAHLRAHGMIRQGPGFQASWDSGTRALPLLSTPKLRANTVGGTATGKTEQSPHPNSCQQGLWNKKIQYINMTKKTHL